MPFPSILMPPPPCPKKLLDIKFRISDGSKFPFVEVVKKKGDKMSDIFHSFGDMLGGGGKSSGTTTPQKSAVTPVNNKQQTAGKHQPGK